MGLFYVKCKMQHFGERCIRHTNRHGQRRVGGGSIYMDRRDWASPSTLDAPSVDPGSDGDPGIGHRDNGAAIEFPVPTAEGGRVFPMKQSARVFASSDWPVKVCVRCSSLSG